MLYSAKYNFIYSKTAKTASTSCETALEYLIRGTFAPAGTSSLIYEDGSRIGYRGNKKKSDPNFGTAKFSYNHQSLFETKEQITPSKFNSVYKISSIRNPYDRLVSHFHFFDGEFGSLEEFIELKRSGKSDEIRRRFEEYCVNKPVKYNAREHWYIGSDMLIDKFVRMEHLSEDIADILNYLKVPTKTSKIILSHIPQYKKSGRRESCLNVADYFTEKTLEMVNNHYSDWFSFGGYTKHNFVVDFDKCS